MKTPVLVRKKQAKLARALEEAVRLHRQGEFDQAEGRYAAVLAARPDQFDALHNLAVIRSQQERLLEARDLIAAAVRVNPASASALSNFGLVLTKMHRPEEALAKFEAALAIRPDFASALNNRGNALLALGRPEEALASYDKALAVSPDLADAHNNRGNALQAIGRPEAALASYERALAIKPGYVEALANRGNALMVLERFEEALASYYKALAIKPDYAEAIANRDKARKLVERRQEALSRRDASAAVEREHAEALFKRGNVLLSHGQAQEALASFDRALALEPRHVDALNNRGVVLQNLGRFEEALASYDLALAVKPEYAGPFNNRSVALKELGRSAEALEAADRALALEPDHASARYNRGNALQDLGRIEEAVASYDQAIAIRPDYPEALFNRGMTALSLGRFAQGWAGYEHRWEQKTTPKKLIDAYPAWKGEDLRGKRIIVYEEQGFGDIIQFSRFLPRLVSSGASVAFLLRTSMHRLLRPLSSTIRLTDSRTQSEPFDFQCAMMSLPGMLGTTVESIPSDVPYLAAEAPLVDSWRARIGERGFRIGICWQGKPTDKIDVGRSIPLRCFRPLAAVPGVRLISLQKKVGLDQLADLPEGMMVENLGVELDNGPAAFIDTAAAMSSLDLIVTSDTSVAHLAGALGRPVWVVLKHVPDWRWLLDRSDCPWYPTMRLYRQPVRGDWDGAFERVVADLAEFSASQGGAAPNSPALVQEEQPGLARALKDALRLHERGDLDQAERRYAAILEAQPGHFDARHNLAVIRFQRGHFAEGLELIEAAVKSNPTSASALSNFGLMLTKSGRPEEALTKLDAALALQPGFATALNNRSDALRELGRPREALASSDEALALEPDSPGALNNRGNALQDLGRPEEALTSYDKALSLKPDLVEAHCNRGGALILLQRPEEALASYDKALALDPNYAEAHFNRGTTALSMGDFAAGWASYEHRWDQRTTPEKPVNAYPEWKGEDIRGKRIVVYEEQGFGDIIQFSRFLPRLTASGASVAFFVRGTMHRLLQPFAATIRLTDKLRRGEPFEFQCALVSLPAVLGTTLETIPSEVPYLIPEAPLIGRWRERIGEHGLKIGTGWQGKPGLRIDMGRSVPLRCFRPLAAIPGVRLISLQKNDGLDQLSDLPSDMTIEDLGQELDTGPDAFVDTAAVMSCLDLIVTSDTAIAHLAGALARPVWVLLKQAPDWRWLLERSDSPWYPTMKLYRQTVRGDWDDVFARVAADVAKLAAGQGHTATTPPWHEKHAKLARALKEAVWLHQRGEIDQAERHYAAILEIQPGHFDAMRHLAVVRSQQGRHLEGLDLIAAAVRSNPKSASALSNFGLILAKLHRPEEALEKFDAALAIDPDFAPALNNRGNALLDLGRPEEALASYDKALAIRPDFAEALNNRGNALKDLGRPEEALASIDKALAIKPHYVEALNNRGGALIILKRPQEALESYDKAIALEPDCVEALDHRSIALRELGRLREALASVEAALVITPDSPEALNNHGIVLTGLGRHEEALASYDKSLALRRDNAEALYNRGNALAKPGRLDEALASWDEALAIRPDYIEALNNRGKALVDVRRPGEALTSLDKALAIRPAYAEALNNRGNALVALMRPEEALASFDAAIAIRPNYAMAHNNRGIPLRDLQRFQEALASYDSALALEPDFAEAFYNRATIELSRGNWQAGWIGYERRWDHGDAPQKRLIAPYPAWRGEDVRGKSIIVYEEQGFGDVIQFSRYLTRLASLGASVTFLVRTGLHRLLQSFAAKIRLVDRPPPGESFDFQSALLSLPMVFGTTPETVPSDVPYLRPESSLVDHWRRRIGDHGLKIGIAWQGNPAAKIDIGRSIPLRCFHQIATVPGVRLISIQREHGLEQLADLPEGMTVENLGAELDNGPAAFVDTAAVMSCLDLVITSDTSIAHLAGALGRPVWVVLKHVADWRWLLDRCDSPWYPTMKLYRQSVRGDWDGVFARVAADVAKSSATPRAENATLLRIPGSIGELFDKITILEIKAARIEDATKLRNVEHELGLLRTLESQFPRTDEHDRLVAELKQVNETLWEIEDAIRERELGNDFGPEFVSLARSVYKTNDRRAAIKKLLNILHGSSIVEEKNYAKYV